MNYLPRAASKANKSSRGAGEAEESVNGAQNGGEDTGDEASEAAVGPPLSGVAWKKS